MKKLVLVLVCAICLLGATGCGNYDTLNFCYTYDYAIIQLQNGTVVEGKIKSWRDYEDGEQLQITMEDGTIYLTNSFNCTLIKKGDKK